MVDFDSPGGYQQLFRLRIAVTDSRFDRFRRVASEEEYLALPLEDRGSIEYHILNAAGTETRVAREVYDKVDDERKGSLVYYQRERPRLADIEVWTQGDNISLGVIDGGGSVALTGSRVAAPGFDGLHETQYLQLVWSSDPRYHDRGILNLDLGARFWLDFFRMVGWFYGTDEVVTWISDGSRDPNGNLRFTEIDPRSERAGAQRPPDLPGRARAGALHTHPDLLRRPGAGGRVQHRRPHPRVPDLRRGLSLPGHPHVADHRAAGSDLPRRRLLGGGGAGPRSWSTSRSARAPATAWWT